jgi:hypothetical protein
MVQQVALQRGPRSARYAAVCARLSTHRPVVPGGRTRTGASRREQSRTHRDGWAAGRAEWTARADAETVFFAAGCALCSLSFFLWVTPICCSAFQRQWRDTPNCRARSFGVMSAYCSTWHRRASQFSLRECRGPGRWYVNPPGLSHRYTLASPTLNLRAASALLPPARTNATTRVRKSDEHLMPLC